MCILGWLPLLEIFPDYASGSNNASISITPNTTNLDSSIRGSSCDGSRGGLRDDSYGYWNPDLMRLILM